MLLYKNICLGNINIMLDLSLLDVHIKGNLRMYFSIVIKCYINFEVQTFPLRPIMI